MIGAVLKIAMRALARNKGRSALTMLGIIIGVASVIAMVGLGQGAQKQVSDTRWNECRLVITTRYPAGDAAAGFTVTQTLWLEADALVVDTVRGASQANRTTYRRAAAAGGT